MGAQGDLVSASRNMAVLASIKFRSNKFRSKELELKGMNMRTDEGEQIHFTATDYADRYQAEVGKNKDLTERVASLEGQIAALQGKERPGPPQPLN